jgi:hypothetical protein
MEELQKREDREMIRKEFLTTSSNSPNAPMSIALPQAALTGR